MTDLSSLIERIEKSEEASFALEKAIHLAIHGDAAKGQIPPAYTVQVDRAIALIPGGLHFSAQTDRDGAHVSVGRADSDARGTFYVNCHHGDAKTLALAICAAALKARNPSE